MAISLGWWTLNESHRLVVQHQFLVKTEGTGGQSTPRMSNVERRTSNVERQVIVNQPEFRKQLSTD
jgi:hypothetical protein